MFYSQYILAKKGPLGKIWLAAHFEKKLTKSQVYATDISDSVQSIINPTVPLALRVCGHLMLGIVRIYSDKVRYLSADARDAMTKINLAFRPHVTRLDVDIGVSGAKIDDANYAQLPMEEDVPMNVPFAKRPLRRLTSKLDESEVVSFFTIGDIELVRRDESRPSIQTAKSTPLLEVVRRSDVSALQRMDEDLPVFDIPMDDLMDKDVTKQDIYPGFGSFLLPEIVEEAPAFEVEEVRQFEFPQQRPLAVPKKKKRRVELEEETEISEDVWRQRIAGASEMAAKRPSTHPRFLTEDDLEEGEVPEVFEDVTGFMRMCPELLELALGSIGGQDERIPFNLKEQFRTVVPSETPEIARRGETLERREPSLLPSSRRETIGEVSPLRPSLAPDFPVMMAEDSFDHGFEDYSFRKETSAVSRAVQMQLTGEEKEEVAEGLEPREEEQHERTAKVLSIVEAELATQREVAFDTFCEGCTRSVAARFFLELLQLKTWGKIDLQQRSGLDAIIISKA